MWRAIFCTIKIMTLNLRKLKSTSLIFSSLGMSASLSLPPAFFLPPVVVHIAPIHSKTYSAKKSLTWSLAAGWCQAGQGTRNLFVCLFSKAGIDFLSLLWIITQTGNRKPLLLQGLCPKWFSGSFCLEFSFFCPTEKENETRAGRPPGDRASALYSEMRNHCESCPGLTAKDYICASAQRSPVVLQGQV